MLEKQHGFKKSTVRKLNSYTEHFTLLEDKALHCSGKNNGKVSQPWGRTSVGSWKQGALSSK